MTIETKYNIGNEVYYRDINTIAKGKILNIKIDCNYGHHNTVIYSVSNQDNRFTAIQILEWELFPTKEELLKSL